MSLASSAAASAQWYCVCPLTAVPSHTGVTALVNGEQIAVFRVGERLYALDNHDPFSGANVISRGIIGDKAGVLKVASPVYKQSFALEDGRCLDDENVRLRVWPIRANGETIEVLA